MKIKLAVFALALSTPAFANSPATVDEALAQAKKTHQPVLLDFGAPWCYSCYFMMTHVLNGPEWKALEARTVVTEVDADSPDGAAWMKKLQVKALPAYVVLNENGDELGRILGEQARAKFYPAVDKILAGSHTLDQLKNKRSAGNRPTRWRRCSVPTKRARKARLASTGTRACQRPCARAQRRSRRSALARSSRARACDEGEGQCRGGRRGEARARWGHRLRPAVCRRRPARSQRKDAGRPSASRCSPRRSPHSTSCWTKDVFIAKPTCADQRSSVIVTADVDAALGDAKAETAVLDRAIEQRASISATISRRIATRRTTCASISSAPSAWTSSMRCIRN